MTIPTRSLVDELDRCLPAANHAQLGTLLADFAAQFNALRTAVEAIYLRNAFLITAPTMTIKAAESPTAKMSTALRALTGGNFVAKSADTDLTAIAGSLATAKYALWAWYIDSAGTLSISTKTADQTTAAAALAAKPAVPDNKVEIGYVIIHNTSGSGFTGGTTALDATGITATFTTNAAISAFSAEAVTEIA